MAQTFGTSASAIKTAGANINATIAADATQILIWANQHEDYLCGVAQEDLVAAYGTLETNGKKILDETTEKLIAVDLIGHEPESIGVGGATLRVNILLNQIQKNVALIKDTDWKTYVGAI